MCTVTFIARQNGYLLGMNRDERLTRAAALPPARHRLGTRETVFPSEPNGGTWIGVNDAGVTFALINWYSVNARVEGRTTSRGEVVKAVLTSDSPAQTDVLLAGEELNRVNPFRLIGIFQKHQAVVEWRWNLKAFECLNHAWQNNTWISSGYDEPGAQLKRREIFNAALLHETAGEVEWLRELHRSHGGERGPYSHCMHRADAATVSYTEVTILNNEISMQYSPGALCSVKLLPPRYLQGCCAI